MTAALRPRLPPGPRPGRPRYCFPGSGTSPWEWAPPERQRETYAARRARWERNMLRMYGTVPSPIEQWAAYEALYATTPGPAGLTLTRGPDGRWGAYEPS